MNAKVFVRSTNGSIGARRGALLVVAMITGLASCSASRDGSGGDPTARSSSESPSLRRAAAAQTDDARERGVPPYEDPYAPVEARVADLMDRMDLDDKIGQITQVDRQYLTSESDIATYRIGSLLSGGGSAPTPNTPAAWADMYDRYQSVALAGPLAIPILYGIDAVHGHNNVEGATIFPHNIGLGATRDPELVERVGRVTALEVLGTGIPWTFSPCLCAAQNERWGRTYESFGDDPELVTAMSRIVTGYQGHTLGEAGSVMATAKHWVGDGATKGGQDQGDADVSEADLRRYMAPYAEAIRRNVGAVMVSYSSWRGVKMHANAHLITDVLKGELGFRGIVVSDWAAVNQLPGDYPTEVRTALNAGIDMIMVPDDYRTFIAAARGEVLSGSIAMARIDDAVRRILTKKFELRLFERPYANRAYTRHVGSAAHRAVAREAVRESLVLLKNDRGVLPLSPRMPKIFVAGKNADDIGNQSGGWTITWQGASGNTTAGTTILQGIRRAASAHTTVTYDREAHGVDATYGAAVVVIGEGPYAEKLGDRQDSLGLDAEDSSVLARVRATNVPMIVVIVSGRPLVITREIDGFDALVAAWLPGTEGQGVADVLFGDYPPTGKLPRAWPQSAAQVPTLAGGESANGGPLFASGFGLTYR